VPIRVVGTPNGGAEIVVIAPSTPPLSLGRTEEIGRGDIRIFFFPYTRRSYSIIVSYRRTSGIHIARPAFGAE
jgi:hypothetical protein